jgi:Zn-dependent M16 (insulinase) family peptidase
MRGIASRSSPRHNFALVDYHHVDGLNMSVLHARHEPSGAHFVHLERDDRHLAHGIAFRTPVQDDRGLPHILEHCVLCGSHRYPVKDPFFLMLNRSVATYMNAWTSSEHTFYPFSTENVTDFKNLRSVYMDAVFNPLLREQDFKQEAWSFSPQSELKGVVFNEMKGSMSDPDTLFYRRWHAAFFKDTPYSFNNGGEPLEILKTTHSDLLSYHQRHYRPLNCLIVAYGQLDLEEEFKFLDGVLTSFAQKIKQPYPQLQSVSTILQQIQKTPNFEAAGTIKEACPSNVPGVRFLRSFLANNTTDLQENFDLRVLSALLLDGPAAPLHKRLLEENSFGKDFAPGTGYDSSAFYASFGVGIDGLAESRVSEFKDSLNDALLEVYKEGFPAQHIEGIIHQLSLQLRYQSTSFGLNMSSQLAAAWSKGTYICESLDVPARMRHFEQNDPQERLRHLLKKYLIDNSSYLDFQLHPDESMLDRLQQKEALFIKQLNPTENMLNGGDQSRNPTKELLPMIKIEDIGMDLKDPSMPSVMWPASPKRAVRERFALSTPTCNELVYLRLLGIHESWLSGHLPYLPMALNLLTELGAGELSADKFDSLVKRLCGGLDVSFYFNSYQGMHDMRVELSTYALESKISTAVDLFGKSLRQCRWDDVDRIKLLVGQAALSSRNSIADKGNKYAVMRAASQLAPLFRARELTAGLSQVAFLHDLALQPDMNFRLNGAATWAINTPLYWKSALTRGADAEVYGENQFDTLLNSYVSLPPPLEKTLTFATDQLDVERLLADLNSSYSAMTYLTERPLSTTDKAAMLIFTSHIRSKLLHQEIREQGGAYGAAATFEHSTGLLALSSYRDPQPQKSIDIFTGIFDRSYDISDEDLREAKLGIIQSWDAPKDVCNQGLVKFRMDIDDVERLALRRAVLCMSLSSFKERLAAFKTWSWKASNFVLKNSQVNQ